MILEEKIKKIIASVDFFPNCLKHLKTLGFDFKKSGRDKWNTVTDYPLKSLEKEREDGG